MAMAEALLSGPGRVIGEVPEPYRDAGAFAQLDFALKFYRLPPAVRLRAIVEDWDYNQCKAWTL